MKKYIKNDVVKKLWDADLFLMVTAERTVSLISLLSSKRVLCSCFMIRILVR